mgnify:CR=1 FL=1
MRVEPNFGTVPRFGSGLVTPRVQREDVDVDAEALRAIADGVRLNLDTTPDAEASAAALQAKLQEIDGNNAINRGANTVFIDINSTLPNGAPNPNFRQPYTEFWSYQNLRGYELSSARASARATPSDPQ